MILHADADIHTHTIISICSPLTVPSNVHKPSATTMSPEGILVRWFQPLQLNGPASDISYTVQYSTEKQGNKVMLEINDVNFTLGMKEIELNRLFPNHEYTIHVRTTDFYSHLYSP